MSVPSSVFDKFVYFCLAYYLSSLLVLTKCFWPFDSKKLPSAKPKLKSPLVWTELQFAKFQIILTSAS